MEIRAVYVENGQEKSSLDEHRRRVRILEHNKKLTEQHPVFTWSHTEDPEIAMHGIRVAFAKGDSNIVQAIVEKLSYDIGYKCDYGITRKEHEIMMHIDVPQKGFLASIPFLKCNEYKSLIDALDYFKLLI